MIYKNGNTIVKIKEDGTKIRYVPDNEPARPVYPESIDMKISNRCDMGCPMCHEKSIKKGKLADLSSKLIDSLHPYTEVAIGGGDPMTHPDLYEFLLRLKEKNVIANLTVHWKSFMINSELLYMWSKLGLIHGLGVSINEMVPAEVIEEIRKFRHAVVHTIAGIVNENVLNQLADKNLNILFLGYKTYGRGETYNVKHFIEIVKQLEWLKRNLVDSFYRFRAVSFDNLAISQLGLKDLLKNNVYNQVYMGDDGTFTMYIDLVENKYGVSSTSKRNDIYTNSIELLFEDVQQFAEESK